MAINFGNVLGDENTTASTAANAPTDGLLNLQKNITLRYERESRFRKGFSRCRLARFMTGIRF